MSFSEVARKYNISVNSLYRWIKSCDRKKGAGRKVNDAELEDRLITWI